MAELKKLLTALIKGQGSFEQVNAAVESYLARAPGKAPQVARLLKAARNAGLPHHLYVSLNGNVPAAAKAVSDPDATRVVRGRPSNGGGGRPGRKEAKTIVLNPGPAENQNEVLTPPADRPTATDAALDDDATRINPDLPARPPGNGEGTAPTIAPSFNNDAAGRRARDSAGGVDFDLLSDETRVSAETAPQPGTASGWPEGSSARPAARGGAGVTRDFREGDQLRNRFELLSKLGEGGMGAVWKGKDLLKEVVEGMKLVSAGRLTAARNSLAAAKAKDPGHGDIRAFEQALESAMARATSAYRRYAEAAGSSRTTRDQAKFDNQYAGIRQLWSDNPEFKRIQVRPPRRGECSGALAGYGRRRGGECRDMLGRAKGPLMVVVPAGGSIGEPFAISKYEISGSDFNDFCDATGSCQRLARSKARLPVTSISVSQAEAYARWLSQAASESENRDVVYRLPTEAEWEHAARAGGAQPEKKYNCRVTAGGSVISGHDLIDAASGAQNGWGLANYVGNAREWVRPGNGLEARGGAFEDPPSRCDISNSRNHSGQPDGLTGFRLVRELN